MYWRSSCYVPVLTVVEIEDVPLPSPTEAELDLAISALQNGRLLRDVAREIGKDRHCLSKHLRARRGFSPKAVYRPASNRKQLDEAEILRAYKAGQSVKALAERFNVGRPLITRRLFKHGVEIRDISEAGKLVWAEMSPEERRKQVKAAHRACLGRIATIDERRKKARAHSGTQGNFGYFEKEIAKALRDRGFEVTPQGLVAEIYCVDLLIDQRIAMEVSCQSIGRYRAEDQFQRAEYIANAGLSLFYVHVRNEEALWARFEEIVTDLNALRRLPAGVRENRVVRCTTHRHAFARNDLGQIASMLTPPEHKYVAVEANWLP